MSSAVAFLDLAAINGRFESEFADALDRVRRSGQWILGPELAAFEAEFASACGVDHAVGVANGLEALELVLRAWDVGPGDEVVVPSHTFVATWLAVTAVGATVVPVEPDPQTYCIGAAQVEPALTSRTRCILPVHLYGRPAPMDELLALASGRGIRVLEDAAQSHGAVWRGRATGGLADAAAFSFYPAKNLGALGDGGMVTTRDAALARRVRSLRNYGSERRYIHDEVGRNSRLDELQAAFLRAKLPRLAADNARRTEIAACYLRALAGVPGLHLPAPDTPECRSAWHLFVVRHPLRDRLARALSEQGIATQVHYPVPPHRQGAYRSMEQEVHLPQAEAMADEVLSLPIGPTMDAAAVDAVVAAVRRTCDELRPALGAGRALPGS